MVMKQSLPQSILTQKQKNYYWKLHWLYFESVYTKIVSNVQKYFGKGSGWIIDSDIYHIINISKYNPLAGSSYTKLPKTLKH